MCRALVGLAFVLALALALALTVTACTVLIVRSAGDVTICDIGGPTLTRQGATHTPLKDLLQHEPAKH